MQLEWPDGKARNDADNDNSNNNNGDGSWPSPPVCLCFSFFSLSLATGFVLIGKRMPALVLVLLPL